MKMFDEDALSIADAVRAVIEGRIKKEVAEPEAKGEKDFKDAHTIDKEDDVEEAVGYTDVEEGEELSAKQKKYQDFFKKALAKFGAKSPQDLDKEKRAEFFDYIDKNYEGDDEVAEDSAPMVEAPSTVIHAEMPFQLFDKAGTSMMFNLSKDWNVNAVAQSNDRYVAFAGEPRDLEKMLKNHPKLKGKVDVKAIMSTAVKFTGKEKFGRQKGANFTN